MSTTIGELVEHLLKYPQDLEVFQSKDAEGNGFLPLEDADTYFIERDVEEPEYVFDKEEIFEDADEDEEDVLDNFKEVLVLWPA